MNKFLTFSFFILILLSCKKDTPQTYNLSYSYTYFGLIKGNYVLYEVVEITHDENALIQHDTLRYQLKTLIGDTLYDNSGRIANRFFRSKRPNANAPWSITDVWTTIIADNKAELVEENQRVVKLIFPFSKQMTWNSNQFNPNAANACFYSSIDYSGSIGSFVFDHLAQVEQADERNLVVYKRQFEVYAQNIGLVRKYYKDLIIANFDTLNIKSGKELFMEVIGYGN